MTVSPTLRIGLEILGWWACLALLWLMFISAVDTLELIVGASVALVGALAAWAAGRAVSDR